jgi:hypothetical protein
MPFEANIIHKIDIKAQRSFYCALLSSLDNRKMYSQLVLLDEYRLVLSTNARQDVRLLYHSLRNTHRSLNWESVLIVTLLQDRNWNDERI